MEFNAYFFFIGLVFILKIIISNKGLTPYVKLFIVIAGVFNYGAYLATTSIQGFTPNFYKISQQLYGDLGVSRLTTVEEAKSYYRKLSVKLSPDKSSEPDAEAQFIVMQRLYSVLSNPSSRASYEAYGNEAVVNGDAAGFYFVWMMLAYGMTCSTRTEYAGRLILLAYILLGLSEFEVKTTISNAPPYGYTDFTVFEWFVIVRAVFPALAALFMTLNEWRHLNKEAASEVDFEKKWSYLEALRIGYYCNQAKDLPQEERFQAVCKMIDDYKQTTSEEAKKTMQSGSKQLFAGLAKVAFLLVSMRGAAHLINKQFFG
mmetsp:Transcript_15694/g.28633  ORF Transcript_15694/g.28633 Transcript_15694/m.28633 type:complete len:316 (+) Transcript_15694:1308-2255(+)